MDVAARLEALEAENERLRARVSTLEAALGMKFRPPPHWRLTGQEACLLGALHTRDLLTKDGAMAALYRDEGRDEPEIKIVDVFICKLRKKLKPFGITIETEWGRGYYLKPEMKRRISEALAEMEVAA